jgi:hypothetical protein
VAALIGRLLFTLTVIAVAGFLTFTPPQYYPDD